MTLDNEKNKSSFELQLIIIAILIPIFLEIFPNLIDKILIFLPIGNLKLNLVLLFSIFLGVIWFLVLVIGLIQFNSDRKFFNFSFKLGTWLTVLTLSMIVGVYFIYTLNLYIGYETIINIITIILGLLIIYIGFKNKK